MQTFAEREQQRKRRPGERARNIREYSCLFQQRKRWLERLAFAFDLVAIGVFCCLHARFAARLPGEQQQTLMRNAGRQVRSPFGRSQTQRRRSPGRSHLRFLRTKTYSRSFHAAIFHFSLSAGPITFLGYAQNAPSWSPPHHRKTLRGGKESSKII